MSRPTRTPGCHASDTSAGPPRCDPLSARPFAARPHGLGCAAGRELADAGPGGVVSPGSDCRATTPPPLCSWIACPCSAYKFLVDKVLLQFAFVVKIFS